ncbi:MAG: phosphoribosylanthranilate isomerase [Desulfobacula sp.]|uniref:phosphoribosylanthranilate isomerase n=1 Tax=Desulfobacula sp. TaxID=2593537 RepID=UPI0025C298A3|nr:phosphoribosylanthranilate isomerase [Desulfobacula sp.]MCD4718295.1 phosphoribosylanthranilate isomerase [Desulfobacula sp.]
MNKIIKQIPVKIQVKICGLTKIDEAQKIAALGVNAIGLVFYPKSKRNIDLDTAKKIQKILPSNVSCVGVFVNESFSSIMKIVNYCNLDAVQLHGNETKEMILKLKEENFNVIKALYMEDEPNIKNAKYYGASSYLVECRPGKLPGGNAHSWDWGKTKSYKNDTPLILAGGLTPDNIKEAILSCMPDAVDISSGVEISPGHKDILKVKNLLTNMACAWEKITAHSKEKIRKVFL